MRRRKATTICSTQNGRDACRWTKPTCHLFGTLFEYWGRGKDLNYFRRLADNDPSMRRGKTLQAQILGAGEVHIAPWLYGYRPLQMKREGAPVDISLLQPVLSVPTYLLLAKNATHPHSAALFLDWALSRDGIMKVLAEELGRGVPRTGYKDIFPELNAAAIPSRGADQGRTPL